MASKKTAKSQIANLQDQGDESELEVLVGDLVTAVKGMSGTKVLDGILEEEYNQELNGQKGAETFDKMRRSDAQISAVLMAMELPIRNAYWFIEAATDEDGEIPEESQKIADFVEDAIFNKMEDGWDTKLREILTFLPFGYSLFEKTYKSDGKNVWIEKLGFRKQVTIMRWITTDRKPGVQQQLPTPGPNGQYTVDIPGHNLLLFTFRKEGDNYAGISVLRSCYKNYYIKDKLYKFDAVKHERQGVGIPVIYLPKNATKAQKTVAAAIVKSIRATEQTGVVMPGSKNDGWLFEFANLNAGTGTDLWESIKHHNREIAKNVLAQFLELGDSGSGGSYSLGADQSDLFVSNLTAVANSICEVMNKYLVQELVDLNFDTEYYPKLRCQKIQKTDVAKLAETIVSLTSGQIIAPDENIEDYMRDLMGLPAREKDDGMEEPGDMGIDDEEPEDPTAEDDMVKELEDLANQDGPEAYAEFMENLNMILEFAEGATFRGPLSEEHKKAISEALKKKY